MKIIAARHQLGNQALVTISFIQLNPTGFSSITLDSSSLPPTPTNQARPLSAIRVGLRVSHPKRFNCPIIISQNFKNFLNVWTLDTSHLLAVRWTVHQDACCPNWIRIAILLALSEVHGRHRPADDAILLVFVVLADGMTTNVRRLN